ncbi:MAG: hypothetical protein HQK87_08110, partial [Nitrospinae bacterium]|nr:hypothetical protein [Nitrospinota bacterium]
LSAFALPIDFGWQGASDTASPPLADGTGKGIADFLFTVVLSGLSGGALPLVAAAAAGSGTGVMAGGFFATYGWSGGTVEAAFLSLPPWSLITFVGNLMGAVAAASWFAMKLEKRPVNAMPLIRYGLLGISLVLFAVVLHFLLGPTWEEAYRAALSGLSPR